MSDRPDLDEIIRIAQEGGFKITGGKYAPKGVSLSDSMSDTPADGLREQIYLICRNNKEYEASDAIMQLIAQDRAKLLQSLLAEKRTLTDYVNVDDKNNLTYYNVEAVPVSAIKALQKVTEGKI